MLAMTSIRKPKGLFLIGSEFRIGTYDKALWGDRSTFVYWIEDKKLISLLVIYS